MKKAIAWTGVALLVTLVVVVVCPDPALAAPGGKIASAFAKSWWGRMILGVLTLIFAPLIVWVTLKERRAIKRAGEDLRLLATHHAEFDWLPLKERISECFHRVHAAWSQSEMDEASEWMTSWYWQNQQLAHLDRWAREGLENVCTVKTIKQIRPLHVSCREDDGELTGSRVVAVIEAEMEDYLRERESGKVVEGKKGFSTETAIWTLAVEGERWVVSNIEQDDELLNYALMPNELPAHLAAAESS